jgi:hypothetical protein
MTWCLWVRKVGRCGWLIPASHLAAGDQSGRAGWAAHSRPAAYGSGAVDCGRGESQEVAARAGHASVSFTLDRYGHLYPDADQALRDRLDALHALSQARRPAHSDGPETDQAGGSQPEGASPPPPHRL